MFNANYELFKTFIKGKKVSVLGLGISNVPAIEFLSKLGAIVCGCDKKTEDKFKPDVLKSLKEYCEVLYLGDDYLDHLDDVDIIIKSPGIKASTPQIRAAVENGKILTGEIEIFIALCPCKVIGVTGSDGKTTTTTLIYEMLKREGYRTHVGGNIGNPLLASLDKIFEDDMVVLELSSFQLQTMRVSPDISVITNITPNHLDYHVDMDEYVKAKANVFNFHKEGNKLVLNADNDITLSFASDYKYEKDIFSRITKTEGAYVEDGCIVYRGNKILDTSEIRIKGTHNVENYLAAICAVYPFVSEETIKYVARNFSGVEHRMEFVRKLEGVSFFNDSIGSTPTRTIAGLNAHPAQKIVLIAGGYDKNLEFDKLASVIHEKVSALVLIGVTADKIKKEVDIRGKFPMTKAQTMDQAVKYAFSLAKGMVDENKDVSVILSPACASFDMYTNFEERGKDFKNIVNSL